MTDSSAGLSSCQVDDWSPGVLFTAIPCNAMPCHTPTPYTRTDPRGPFARFPDWAEMGIPRVSVGPVPYPCSQHRPYYFISIHSTNQVLNMFLVGNYLGCLVLMQQVLQNLEFCCMLLCITQALSFACNLVFFVFCICVFV